MIHLEFWPTLAFVVVMLSWFAFIILFLVRHKLAYARRVPAVIPFLF